MPPALLRALLLLGLLGLLIFFGSQLRASLGLELEVESVRQFAQSLGTFGPLLFVGVVALRAFLALPSQVVLIAAGLCFGTLLGAMIGAAGLTLSGLGLFGAARYAGRESIEARFGTRLRGFLDLSSGWGGGAAIALGTGYPISPLSPIHAGAGLTPMPALIFVVSALAGGLVRAGIFSYFGNAIVEEGSYALLAGAAGLAAVIAAPLAFPSGRRWLTQIFGRSAEN